MKRIRLIAAATAVLFAVNSLGVTVRAETVHKLDITNQYDTEESSRDDNEKNKPHPLEPDVEVAGVSEGHIELASDVEWSKSPENWTAGNKVSGTLYLGTNENLSKSRLKLRVTNGRNEAEVVSVSRYKGDGYESDFDFVYIVKFTYQVAAALGETTWAGWDQANPCVAAWNAVRFADTYRVVLFDERGSVVSQIVEGRTSFDFSQFMTDPDAQYYFEVAAIAQNGNEQDYLEDGTPVRSETYRPSSPGITDGVWGDYQEGRRFTYKDGTAASDKWERIMSKWYYFNEQGVAVTGWNEIGGIWYYFYEDGAMAAGTITPDGFAVNESGAWVR